MQRIKLTIEYDGTHYSGWQRQPDAPSVQQKVEEAIYGFCQEEVSIVCAGRTDAGVHARGQVAHYDSAADRSPYQIREGLNHYLSGTGVAIVDVALVNDEFHARFSATGRKYCYRIIHRSAPLTLEKNRAWQIYGDLDIQAMQEAASHLLGNHDFTSFRAVGCQSNSAVKTLDRLDIIPNPDDPSDIRIYVEALSFLYNQVRIMTGSLIAVGQGKCSVGDFIAVRDAKDRTKAGVTAPACGLYLTEVTY